MSYFKNILELAKVNDYHLYHTLEAYKAYKILTSNELKLPLAESNSSESKFTGKMFYLSFARTPSSGYIADRASGLRQINEQILFVFDRRKLNNIRGSVFKSVDYWGVNSSGRIMGGASKEAEERMFSPSPIIKGIASALLEVRVALDSEDFGRNRWVLETIIAAKKKKIPVKLFSYKNKQGYLLGKEDSTESKFLLQKLKEAGFQRTKFSSFSEASRSSIVRKKYPLYNSRDWLMSIAEYVFKNSYEELTPKAQSQIYYDLRSSEDFFTNNSSNIHNLRAGPEQDRKRFYSYLKATKAKSVKQFFEFLYNKWTKLYNERQK